MKPLKYIWPIAILIVTLLCSHTRVAAQDIIDQSIIEFQAGNLDKAKELIDKGSMLSLYSKEARTWYYKGYIYKELFKERKNESYRDSAIAYLLISIELDNHNEYKESATKMANFLVSSIFNETAEYFNELAGKENNLYQVNEATLQHVIEKYQRFKYLKSRLDPSFNFNKMDEEFYFVAGNVYLALYENSNYENENYREKIEYYYNKVLEINPKHDKALYNLGIVYYNKAVYLIKNLDYDADFMELEKKMDECVNLFEKALPYIKKSLDVNPQKVEAIRALKGIYRGLNNYEMVDYYDQQLKSLEKR